MSEVFITEIAWLAGLIDGEGSIGIYAQSRSATSYYTTCQINMTHEPTIREARRIIEALGVRGCTYTYSEKQSHHKDAHLLTVRRAWDLRVLARAVLPYSVTKRAQWTAMLEYLDRRLEGTELDAEGRIRRGGKGRWWKPLEAHDLVLIGVIRAENRRETPVAAGGGSPLDPDRNG